MKIKAKKNKKRNIIPEIEDEPNHSKKWYDEAPKEPKTAANYTEQVLIELKEEASKCHAAEVLNYNSKKQNANAQWMKTMLSRGTVSDKIAAHSLLIQENPVCNLDTLRNLVSMVKVSKKKECVAVLGTLVEIFLTDLLIPTRKLKPFHQRPLAALNEMPSEISGKRKKLLTYWYFEDQLKEIYTSFVLALNTVGHDTVESNKDKAITAMYKLLAGNPEQEKNLLSHIVNKLGDPSQKIASKVIYCLTQLLYKHPNMQKVVLDEIEKLLFRTNISKRAQYYSLCFLSQYHLSHETPEVAKKLIEMYFAFFKSCVKTGDVDSRMMSALLMGLNRAYPYAKVELSKISEHIETMYRLVHLAQFNTSLQALILLYQVCDFESGEVSRFYNALYRKLLEPSLLTMTHKAMFLSLLYKALLKDKEVNRIKAFIKRLLQVSLFVQADFACGILYLVSQLVSKKAGLQAIIVEKSTVSSFDEDDNTDEKYYDVKEGTDEKGQESEKITKGADSNKKSNGHLENATETNSLETNEAVETNDFHEDVKPDIEALEKSLKEGSWYHCVTSKVKTEKHHKTYDPTARNPLYCGGEFCCYTELTALRDHFHPTVSLFARNVTAGETISYSSDPLNDFTLIRFLERFVFKNPKRVDEVGKDPTFSKRMFCRPKGVKLLPVNSLEYVKEDSKNIPVDELFLHTFLQKRHKDKAIDEDESDVESVQSDEFEEMLNQMTGVKERQDEIDYLDEIGDTLKIKKKGKGEKMEDQSESDRENSESEISDQELEDDSDNNVSDLDDFDEESDEDEEIVTNKLKKKQLSKRKRDTASLFASAEEFATLLEGDGSSKVKPGGSNAFANVDNADTKQLAWEEQRNRWVKGYNQAFGKSSKKHFSKGDNNKVPKKRKNKSLFAGKSKRVKK